MKNSDVKDRHDIQLKIQQLRQGSGYVRKFLLAICGTCVASLLTILPMTAGQIAIYILLDNQRITIDLWRLLLILIFASGLFIPVVRGLEIASIANVLMLVFIGAQAAINNEGLGLSVRSIENKDDGVVVAKVGVSL